MAGSDKLYLEPVLKELLDGLNASMQSIDGIVDGLGDAVAEMKSAVDDVKDALVTVQGSINETNDNLEIVNSSIGQTKEMIILPSAEYEDSLIDESVDLTDYADRYEIGDTILSLVGFADGMIGALIIAHGTSGVNPNNPGLEWVDMFTGRSITVLEHANNSGTSQPVGFELPVEKGHSYNLNVIAGQSATDDFVLDSGTLNYAVYYVSPDKVIYF